MTRRILVADNLELLLNAKRDWDVFGKGRVDFVGEAAKLRNYLPGLREGQYGLVIFDPVTLFEPHGGIDSKRPLIIKFLTEIHSSTNIIYTIDIGQEEKIAGFRGNQGIIIKPYTVKPILDNF